jgi:hypothetical protein
MTEPFLKLPRKILSKIVQKDLTSTEIQVMLIILEISYGYHKETIKISTSFVVRALGKEITHSRIRFINRIFKRLKSKECIIIESNKGTSSKSVTLHQSLTRYVSTHNIGTTVPNQMGTPVGTNKDIYKDILDNSNLVAGLSGPAVVEGASHLSKEPSITGWHYNKRGQLINNYGEVVGN